MAAVPSIGRASAVQVRPAAPEAELTRTLYEQHSRQIFNYCLHQLGNREEAEDATQTTFLNAFRGLQRGVVPELESAWLFKIANNVILTRRRSSFRRRRVETPGDLDALQDVLPSPQRNADELIRLTDALGKMPEQQRRALLLREWQGLSYHEIGEELELSQSAVETLLFRARRSLADGLTDPDGAPKRGRLRSGLDLGSLLGLVKGLLTGGAAVKAVATAAVVASSAVVATDPVVRHRAQEPHAPVAKTAAAPMEVAGRFAVAAVALAPQAAEQRQARAARAAPTGRMVAASPHAAPVESVPTIAPLAPPEAAPPQTSPPPAPEATPPAATTPGVPEPAPSPAPTTEVQPPTAPVVEKRPILPATPGKTDRKGAAVPPAVAKASVKGDDRADKHAEKGNGRGPSEGDAKVAGQVSLKKPTAGPVPIPLVPAVPATAPEAQPPSAGATPGNGLPGSGAWKKQDAQAQPQPVASLPAATTPTTTVPVPASPGGSGKGSDGSRQNDHDAGNGDGPGHGPK